MLEFEDVKKQTDTRCVCSLCPDELRVAHIRLKFDAMVGLIPERSSTSFQGHWRRGRPEQPLHWCEPTAILSLLLDSRSPIDCTLPDTNGGDSIRERRRLGSREPLGLSRARSRKMHDVTEAPVEVPGQAAQGSLDRFRRNLRNHVGWMLSLFLIGFAAKLLLIQVYGDSLPYLDQWDGEGGDIYIPYFEHALYPADLFRAHNEHRIFWTRIYDLGLLLMNGQWDSQLQMVVSAALHCATVAGFGWIMAGLLGTRKWPWIWLPLVLVLALPYAWENTIWGFQSQFYFLLLFGLLTLWLLGLSEPWSGRWRLGALAGVGSLFTMASGFLVAGAVAAMVLLEMARDRTNRRRHLATLGLCALLGLAGWLLVPDVPAHHALRAHSIRAFLVSLGAALVWPTQEWPWLAPLNLFPLLALGWLYLRSRGERRPAELMILGTGLWVVLQSLAAAYARGAEGEPPVPRYMDTSSFLLIANSLSIVLLLTRYRRQLRFAPVWYVAFVIWAVPCVSGLWMLTEFDRKIMLPVWRIWENSRVATTRAFLATDDGRSFQTESRFAIPYPYVPLLEVLLRTPSIRKILPACVRDPLKVVRRETGDAAFVTNGWALATPDPPAETSWGSCSALGVAARGTFESLPVKRSSLPYLEIAVAGDLGGPGLSLELVDPANGKITAVIPSRVPGRAWLHVRVKAPKGEFKVVARDESESGWFAFKAPREMGRFSYWAMEVISWWRYILAGGVGCLLWSGVVFFSRRPSPDASAPSTSRTDETFSRQCDDAQGR
jgi:hypothetical protein